MQWVTEGSESAVAAGALPAHSKGLRSFASLGGYGVRWQTLLFNYLIKPFSREELLARVRASLRRTTRRNRAGFARFTVPDTVLRERWRRSDRNGRAELHEAGVSCRIQRRSCHRDDRSLA